MPDLSILHGRRVLVFEADGPLLARGGDANDFLGLAFEHQADWAAIPLPRLGADFLQLSTKLAGDVMQKFVNYRVGLALVGDIEPHATASGALRDFVRESNRGGAVWFVSDLPDLERRLGERGPA